MTTRPIIQVSPTGFTCSSPAEFNVGGPGTAMIFQADAGLPSVPFTADAGLCYVSGSSGPVNTSETQFVAPVAPNTLSLYVAATVPSHYRLIPSKGTQTSTVNVGMFVSSSDFSPESTYVDAGAFMVFQAQGTQGVRFTAEGESPFPPPSEDGYMLPSTLAPVRYSVSSTASGPYKLKLGIGVGAGGIGTGGDGQINVSSGSGGDDDA